MDRTEGQLLCGGTIEGELFDAVLGARRESPRREGRWSDPSMRAIAGQSFLWIRI